MRKMLLFLFIGTVFGYWIKVNNVLPQPVQQILPSQLQPRQDVKGISTGRSDAVSGLEKELEKIPVSSIASSSPQGRALIDWFQKLPVDQMKLLCRDKCK